MFRVVFVYTRNSNSAKHDIGDYYARRQFDEALSLCLKEPRDLTTLVMGDMNVAPDPDKDVISPKDLEDVNSNDSISGLHCWLAARGFRSDPDGKPYHPLSLHLEPEEDDCESQQIKTARRSLAQWEQHVLQH